MKRFSKAVTYFVVFALSLSVLQIQVDAGKPSTPSPTFTITASKNNTTIKVDVTDTITLTTVYSGGLKWSASTTLGTCSIEENSGAPNHSATLTYSSSMTGKGTLTVTATDSANRKIKSSITLKFTVEAADVPVEDKLVYVALGDSIPYGTYNTSLFNYLVGGTDSNSYIEQLRDQLNVDTASYYDKSVSGYTTTDVLKQLKDTTTSALAVQNAVKSADLITLCIGANDIMNAAARTMSGLDKYNINWTVADAGRDTFELNWSQIVDTIENLNPDVTLIVMTIYNPYRLSDTYYTLVDRYFSDTTIGNFGLNYIINQTETLYGDLFNPDFKYEVADVYTAFNTSSVKDTLTGFYRTFCDPHPNQTGHNLVYSVHYTAYLEVQ